MSKGLCPSCGAPANLTAEQTQIACAYCGTSVVPAEAEQRYKEVSDGKPGGTFMLAELARAGHKYSEALGYYNKVIEQDGKCAEAWLGKGLCMLTLANPAMNLSQCSSQTSEELSQALTPCMYAIQLGRDRDAMRKRVIKELSEYVVEGMQKMKSLAESAKQYRGFLESESGRAVIKDMCDRGLVGAFYSFDRHRAAVVHYDFILVVVLKENCRSEGTAKTAVDFTRSAVTSLEEAEVVEIDEEKRNAMSQLRAKLKLKLDGYLKSLQEINPEAAKKIEEELCEQESKATNQPQLERKKGCFIATACYGDYGHPIVIELRQFRDETVQQTKAGRAFVQWYYRWSPPFANFINKSTILKTIARVLIVGPVLTISRTSRKGAKK